MESELKKVHLTSSARQKLLEGVDIIVNAVGSTLGAKGRTVLIESSNTTGGVLVTKDGVTVAKNITLADPVKNLAVRLVRQASERTAKEAGDGTTTSVVLAGALIKYGHQAASSGQVSEIELIRGLNKLAAERVIPMIDGMAKAVTSEDDVLNVAMVSSNNDPEMARVIADVYNEVGADGVVTSERGVDEKTKGVVTNGVRLKRGLSSPIFINDRRRDVYSAGSGAYVLVSSTEINNLLTLEPVLRHIIEKNKALVVIAPCSQNVVNTIAANVVKSSGAYKWAVMAPPSMGWRSHELMDDIALVTGAKHFSEKTGDDLSVMTIDDLGWVDTATISREDATFVIGGEVSSRTAERIAELTAARERAQSGDSAFINERLGVLSGRAGVILVGGQTDVEQKEALDRVDDAVCAVRSAMERGVVPGGGVCLNDVANALEAELPDANRGDLSDDNFKGSDYITQVMISALRAPINHLIGNSGLWGALETFEKGCGLDVLTGEYKNMMDAGVIDPAKVTVCALENALSVATTILSTSVVITTQREYEEI